MAKSEGRDLAIDPQALTALKRRTQDDAKLGQIHTKAGTRTMCRLNEVRAKLQALLGKRFKTRNLQPPKHQVHPKRPKAPKIITTTRN